MPFAPLGNTNEDNSCYFEWVSLTKPCFINLFNQLKGSTKILLGVPPRSLFYFFGSRIIIIKGYTAETYKVLTSECQKLNSRDNTEQGWFLIRRRVGYHTQ